MKTIGNVFCQTFVTAPKLIRTLLLAGALIGFTTYSRADMIYNFAPDGTGGTTVTLGGTISSVIGAFLFDSDSNLTPITMGDVVSSSSGPEIVGAWGNFGWVDADFSPFFGLGPGSPSIRDNGGNDEFRWMSSVLSAGNPGGITPVTGTFTFTAAEMPWAILNPGVYTSSVPITNLLGDVVFGIITFNVGGVPEPSTAILASLGLSGVCFRRRRK